MTRQDKRAALRVFDDCGRDTLELMSLRIVVRMGRDTEGEKTAYIGLPGNGAELSQSELKQLLPYLERFAVTGKMRTPLPELDLVSEGFRPFDSPTLSRDAVLPLPGNKNPWPVWKVTVVSVLSTVVICAVAIGIRIWFGVPLF